MDRVKFVMNRGECVAVFPDIPWNSNGDLTAYVHNGQHGPCGYNLQFNRAATKTQAADLLAELRRVGYDDLRIVNRWGKGVAK